MRRPQYMLARSQFGQQSLAGGVYALVGKGAAASRQAAINSAKSTGHLIPVGGGASGPEGEVEIPKAELGLWQDMYPGLSYKELRTKYNRTL